MKSVEVYMREQLYVKESERESMIKDILMGICLMLHACLYACSKMLNYIVIKCTMCMNIPAFFSLGTHHSVTGPTFTVKQTNTAHTVKHTSVENMAGPVYEAQAHQLVNCVQM